MKTLIIFSKFAITMLFLLATVTLSVYSFCEYLPNISSGLCQSQVNLSISMLPLSISIAFFLITFDDVRDYFEQRKNNKKTDSCPFKFAEKQPIIADHEETIIPIIMEATNVTVLNLEIAEENEVVRNLMESMDIDDIFQFFEGYPDMINIDGEIVLFTRIENYIIYVDPSYTKEEEVEKILVDFFADKNIEPLGNNWANFTNHTIAYRGGCGYCYSIYRYTA